MLKGKNIQFGNNPVFNSIMLVMYLIGATYVFFTLATSRPHAGAWNEIFLLMFLAGICFRSFLVFHLLIFKKPITRRWLARVLTMVAGLFMAGQLIQLETDMASDRFTRAYQPLVDILESGQIEICGQPGDILNIPDTARPKVKKSEIFGRHQWETEATVYFSDAHFVISVPASSIDIDGSRLYYESKSKKWELFHNDREEEMKIFLKLTENSMPCTVPES